MSPNETAGLTRRGLFRAGAGATAAATTAGAQESFDYGGWFDDVSNFDGTVDRTGEEETTVAVGADGELVFEPAAVHVDPGTTVVFEWDQGFHNVAERESGERYANEPTDEPGTTYSVTFESDGISTYVCEPHESQGMKGAGAVGTGEGDAEITEGEMQTDGGGDGSDGNDGEDGGDGSNSSNGGDSGGEGSGSSGVDVDTDVLALYGVAAVIAFLSPLGLLVLMARRARNESGERP